MDTGLMIVAHGAPSPEWNRAIFEVGKQVESLRSQYQGGSFRGAKVAMLEFAKPNVPEVMAEFEAEGYGRVIVIPLFIAPSGHSHVDLPAVLGLYSDEDVQEEFGGEVAGRLGRGCLPVIVGPTLASGNVPALAVCDQVRELSTSPDSEAVVILAHGDHGMGPVWEGLCREVCAYVCGKTGITWCDWAFVEMGQAYLAEGIPTILRASEARPRVLVASLYVATGADRIAERWGKAGGGSGKAPRGMMAAFANALEGVDVQFSSRGVLPDERVAGWILEEAEAIVERVEGGH